MSYQKTFNDEVSITKRLPKYRANGSEVLICYQNGKQEWVSAVCEEKTFTEPVDITLEVDTDPFDKSVDHCTEQVQALTGSVTLFKEREIITKRANAKDICTTVTTGFLSMLTQNINIQWIENKAKTQALAGELMKQAEELKSLKDRMTTDYNRIKRRYSDLFTNLNVELHDRIYNLMRPCFELVERTRKEQQRLSATSLLSTAIVGGKETDDARTKIAACYVKENASELINAAKGYIQAQLSLSDRLASVQYETCEEATFYLPAFVAVISDRKKKRQARLFYQEGTQNLLETSNNTILQSLQSDGIGERICTPEEKSRLDARFRELLAGYNTEHQSADPRVAQLIEKLYNRIQLKTYCIKQETAPEQ